MPPICNLESQLDLFEIEGWPVDDASFKDHARSSFRPYRFQITYNQGHLDQYHSDVLFNFY